MCGYYTPNPHAGACRRSKQWLPPSMPRLSVSSRVLLVLLVAAAAALAPAAADDFLFVDPDPLPALPDAPFSLLVTSILESVTGEGAPGCSVTRVTLSSTLTGEPPVAANLGCSPATVAGSGTAPDCSFAPISCTGKRRQLCDAARTATAAIVTITTSNAASSSAAATQDVLASAAAVLNLFQHSHKLLMTACTPAPAYRCFQLLALT
jgi:hypothetical protein